jgi:hypothetical protein
MLKKSFFKTIPFLLFIVLFNSCDKEYSVIGADLIGESSFDLIKAESAVVAYNQKIGPIQSDDLPINALGSYYNASFGKTTANFVTQVNLTVPGPTISATAKIKSVVLTIPYFYDKTKTVTNPDGSHVYVLDSIYGPDKARMKLSVYESGYYMRNLDPEEQFLKPQKYFTDQNSGFDQAKIGARLNDDPNLEQNDQFFFSDAEYSVTTTDPKTQVVTTTKNPPAMRLNLNKTFFENKILKASAASLSTNDLFEDYFRGLYFNIEDSGSNSGNLNMINFKAGNVTITYEETEVTNGVSAQVEKTIVLNMSGTTAEPLRSVSLLTQSNTNTDYTNATIDDKVADDNLYLKGGEGSMAILSLFGSDDHGSDGVNGGPNGVADEIDVMRTNKYLINEANLVFHVNATAMGVSPMSQRIYLYDFTNNKVIIDYLDNSVVGSNTKNSKYVYGGILAKDGGGYYYKFRITNHVRNLVKNLDSKNVQLGLVVTEDINNSSFSYLKGTNPFPTQAPKASVMNPLGSIVYGGTSVVPAGKRLKLEIYYTKPN